MERIPVTLLTGFLGSGKSTLLTQILRDDRFANTVVIVNEFGEVGLDGHLIEHTDDQIVEMTSGCLCCTIRGDIRETLLMLHARREKGEIPSFTRLVVESTGLADPAPVIHTLMADPIIERRYMLGGVITTIDAVNGIATLDTHEESQKQAAVADRLVITKTDLESNQVSSQDLAALKSKLTFLNHNAPILNKHDPDFELSRLFDTSLYNLDTKTIDVRRWLNEEASKDDHHHHGHEHHHGHGHEHEHEHDITRHGTDIRSFTLTYDKPIAIASFANALEALTLTQGANLLRVKGIINTTERPEMPLVIHGVQHVFHEPFWLKAWPDDDKRTRIVFITYQIEEQTLDDFFKCWIN